MKIAILAPLDRNIVTNFLPNYDIDSLPKGYAGAPYLGLIIDKLLLAGHEVTCITTSVSLDYKFIVTKFNHGDFTWIVVPSRPYAVRFAGGKIGKVVDFYRLEIKLMLQNLRDFNPNFVHAFWSYEFAAVAKNSGFPYLITIEDNPYQILKYHKPKWFWFSRLLLSEWTLFKVKNCSIISPYLSNYSTRRNLNAKIIPNPVKISLTEDTLRESVYNKAATLSTPILIMINNGWNKRKNGITALRAFQKVRDFFPSANLYLYGDGSETEGIAFKEAEGLDLSNIFFCGPINHDQIIANFSRAHLFIHPSREESLGVVLIEAMAQGVPTIGGLSSGAVPWVINNDNLLVDINEPTEIADKVIEVLENKQLYTNLCLSSFNNVKDRFSDEIVVNEFLIKYDEILSEKKQIS